LTCMAENKTIIVVGAGPAGLRCASLLKQGGLSVIVVEANDYFGGRVKGLKGFVDWKSVDLGAEFIHGRKTVLKKIADEQGFPVRKLHTWAQGDGPFPKYPMSGGTHLYWLGKEKQLLRYDTEEPEILKVNTLLWEMGEVNPPQSDTRTIGQYLASHGCSPTALALADAGYGNTLCTDINKAPLEATCRLEVAWVRDGGSDFRFDNGMIEIPKFFAKDLDIRLKWPVKSIDYREKGNIVVTNEAGQSLSAYKVVVAVPLAILKLGLIDFRPPLPPAKQHAIKVMQMEPAMKIALKFKTQFWPKETHGVICSNSFVPEFWFDAPDRVGALSPESPRLEGCSGCASCATCTSKTAPTYLASAFLCSHSAVRAGKMTKEEVLKNVLAQLDEMFANIQPTLYLHDRRLPPLKGVQPKNSKTPATDAFLDIFIQDWAKEPYIRGGYSCPSFGASPSVRSEMGYPIDGRVYFAGEAFHVESYESVHSAVETGIFAAQGILDEMAPNRPKIKGTRHTAGPRSKM